MNREEYTRVLCRYWHDEGAVQECDEECSHEKTRARPVVMVTPAMLLNSVRSYNSKCPPGASRPPGTSCSCSHRPKLSKQQCCGHHWSSNCRHGARGVEGKMDQRWNWCRAGTPSYSAPISTLLVYKGPIALRRFIHHGWVGLSHTIEARTGAAAATARGGCRRRRRVRAPCRCRCGAGGLYPVRAGGERPLPRARR